MIHTIIITSDFTLTELRKLLKDFKQLGAMAWLAIKKKKITVISIKATASFQILCSKIQNHFRPLSNPKSNLSGNSVISS